MNVEQLLSGKGHDVISVQPHRTLAEAIRTLSERRIGAVVVMGADGALVGILSERDIIRALGELGPSALESAVSRSMTSKVVTCRPQTSVDELMEIMTTGRFRHVPVVENGRVTGIVSIGDVVKKRIQDVEQEAEDIKSYISAA